jgi:hypothetical protein
MGRRLVEQARAAHRTDPGRFARSAVRRLAHGFDGPEALAAWIVEALAHYLLLAVGRPQGALTPLEAQEVFRHVLEDPNVADHARRLVAECDRARFSGRGVSEQALRAEAVDLFQMLSVLPDSEEILSGAHGKAAAGA